MKQTEMERVVIRKEWDEYNQMETYIAVFPDDEANPGRLAFVPFYFRYDMTWFEEHGEMSRDYYYADTKPVKDEAEIQKCVEVLNRYLNYEFKAVKKIVRR